MSLTRFTLLSIALFPVVSWSGSQSVATSPQTGPSDEQRANGDAADPMARYRFAPMWRPVPKYPPVPKGEKRLPVPTASYAVIWQPRWQQELGLSVEQEERLLAINTRTMTVAKEHSERFKSLSPEERQAERKSWAGKSAPWRRRLDSELRDQIEDVLTPQQLKTIRDFSFPRYAVGLLSDADFRREIGFNAQQASQLQGIARERLARFQEVTIESAEKRWNLLTPDQQDALPAVVRRQGPTSAVLSIAWELGFDMDSMVPGYPMLAAVPIRERLGLSDEQETQLQELTARFAAQRRKAKQDRVSGSAESSHSMCDWKFGKQQVESILTPQQLAAFNEIEFRRKVVLALGYPEKRDKIGITAEQSEAFQQLDQDAHELSYRIDCEMLDRVLHTLTPQQREQVKERIKHRFYSAHAS